MRNFIALVFTLTVSLFVSIAHAEFPEGKSAIQAGAGFSAGGFSLGVDYEHAMDRTFGVGGYFRMYPDDDDAVDSSGLTTFGAFIRPHFNRQNWDFYVSPGFGFVSYEPGGNKDDETLIGPSFQIGLLYELKPTLAVGVEHMNIYSWFGDEDYRGLLKSELLANVRFIF